MGVTAGAASAALGAWLWVPLIAQAQTTQTTQTTTGTPKPVPTPNIVSAGSAHGELAFLEFPEDSPGPHPITIAGESAGRVHPGAIEVLAAALGMQNTAAGGSAAGGAAPSRATFQKLRITKLIDRSSPGLFLACTTGASFPSANLYIRKAGNSDDIVYRLKLVVVSNVQTVARSGEDTPQEIIDFAFGALQVEYTRPGAVTPITQAWSVVENQPVFDTTP